MSRFWAAASSSEDEQDSDKSGSDDEQQINQRQAGGKFGYTLEESDSGMNYKIIIKILIFNHYIIELLIF